MFRNSIAGMSFGSRAQQGSVSKRIHLCLETLEDRCVPSATVDLTTTGSIGSINGAIFRQFDQQPSGSGVIDSFVRLKAPGHSTIEQGYNTDARPLQFDENNSPVFTRSLALASIPQVDIGGSNYYEFLLDINQNSSSPLLSLDELRLFVGTSGNLTGYNTSSKTLAGQSAVYDMGAGNWVELNARLSHGSGSSDMTLYVPAADFSGGSYVYLYSKFGVNASSNGGYEEWATGAKGVAVTTDNTANLTGHTFNDGNNDATGVANVPVTLTVTSIQGTPITFTTTSDSNGSFTFSNLFAGTYSVSAGTVGNFMNHSVSVGTVNNVTDGTASGNNLIQSISLKTGDAGINYDFSLLSTIQAYTISGTVTDNTVVGANWMVTLTDTTTNSVQTVSATGSNPYSFSGLTAGDNYTVTITSDTGIVFGSPAPFNDLSMDELANFTIIRPIV